MPGSALPQKLLLVATLAAVVVPNAAAADSRQGAFLPELWGVAGNASFRTPTFARLRRGGINTVVIDSRRLRPRQVRRLTRAAGKARLRVVRPTFLARPSTVDDARTACDVFRNAHHGSACALWESSVSSALTLAQSGAADLVVVHLARPGALRAFAGSSAGRILAIVSLGQHFRARTWRSLIQVASSSATLDLAFAPRRARQKTVSGYLKLLDKSGVTTPDLMAPTSPLGLKIAQQTQTTLGLSWGASYDKRGVAGYDVFVDGALLGRTTSTAYVHPNLPCGTSHIIAVKGFDAAGNRSADSSLRAETSPCDLSPPAPPTPPRGSNDTIAFPRIGQYDSFNFGDGSVPAHFQLNVFLGCNPAMADRSYALNPKQANFIIPTIPISPDGMRVGPNCGPPVRASPSATEPTPRSRLRSRARIRASARSVPGAGWPARSVTTPALPTTRGSPARTCSTWRRLAPPSGRRSWGALLPARSLDRLAPGCPRHLGRRLPLVGPTSRADVPAAGRLRSGRRRPGTTGR